MKMHDSNCNCDSCEDPRPRLARWLGNAADGRSAGDARCNFCDEAMPCYCDFDDELLCYDDDDDTPLATGHTDVY